MGTEGLTHALEVCNVAPMLICSSLLTTNVHQSAAGVRVQDELYDE